MDPEEKGLLLPSITFVVLQVNHGIIMVPKHEHYFRRNVPSGTWTKDQGILAGQHSFLLVSQGGLKGTSKSVLYHVLCDEGDLSTDKLLKITYSLSFHFGKATKATRLIAVVRRCEQLATRFLSYVNSHLVSFDANVDSHDNTCVRFRLPDPEELSETMCSRSDGKGSAMLYPG